MFYGPGHTNDHNKQKEENVHVTNAVNTHNNKIHTKWGQSSNMVQLWV